MPPSIVLLTQVFPPAVGGSGVLLDNVYRRLSDIDVTVVVDRETCSVDSPVDRANLKLVPARIDPAQWGLFDPRGWLTIVRGNPASALDGLGLSLAAPVWLTAVRG